MVRVSSGEIAGQGPVKGKKKNGGNNNDPCWIRREGSKRLLGWKLDSLDVVSKRTKKIFAPRVKSDMALPQNEQSAE